ncbi:oxidoreductase [Chitinilyticum piscinae]|nr:oxidoreductase [Chitinilyticum piscinae]
MNCALLGFGYAGKTFHAPLLEAASDVELCMIQSSRPEAVHAAYPGVAVVADMHAVLANPAIELVVIATPNATHAPLARAALLAGKHVVVDKPFTLTVAEARDLVALARAHGLLLSVFQNRRWDADFLGLQALCAAGELGRVVQFSSQFNRYRPQVQARWREGAGDGAGLWYDLGPHLIDQALLLFGVPAGVTAQIRVMREGGLSPDWAHVQLHYPDKEVQLHASMLVSGGEPRFAVHGLQGSWIKYGLDEQENQLKAGVVPGGERWGLDSGESWLMTAAIPGRRHWKLPAGNYEAFYPAVVAAIRTRQCPPVTALQAVVVMAVLEAALQSSRLGRTVVPQLEENERLAFSAEGR